MYKNKVITVIMPCYNEEEGLVATQKLIPTYIDHIVAVNNNSIDKTKEVAEGFGFIVVDEERPGYGSAYKKGFKSFPEDTDIIVTCDADGTYGMNDLEKILDMVIENDYDFINCSRFPLKDENSMYWLNKIGNWGLTTWFNILTFKIIKDSQTGMWVFKKDVLNKIILKSNDMPFSQEIKMEAALNKNIKFGEYNIEYYERTGKTKLNAFKDGWRNLKHLFAKRFKISIRGFKKHIYK